MIKKIKIFLNNLISISNNKFIFYINDVLINKDNDLLFFGKVIDGVLYKEQEVFILGPKNIVSKAYVKEIFDSSDKKINRGLKNSSICLVSKSENYIPYKYDIVTNIKPSFNFNVFNPPLNLRLSSLLDLWVYTNDIFLMKLIVDEILFSTYFIFPFLVVNSPNANKNFLNLTSSEELEMVNIIINKNNENFIPIYSNLKAFSKAYRYPKEEVAILSFDEINALIEHFNYLDGFIINPSSHNFTVNKEALLEFKELKSSIENIAKNLITTNLAKDKTSNPSLLEALSNYFKSNKKINRAWIHLISDSKNYSYLITLDTNDSIIKLFPIILNISKPFINENSIYVQDVNDEENKEIEGEVPFYKKEN